MRTASYVAKAVILVFFILAIALFLIPAFLILALAETLYEKIRKQDREYPEQITSR